MTRWQTFWQEWRAVQLAMLARPLEAVSALGLMLLGVWFMVARQPLSYSFLTLYLPLPVWGVFFFGVGLVARLGIWQERLVWRQSGVLAIFVVRLFLLGAVAYGTGWASSTLPEHITWCLVSGWAYIQAGRPAGM